MFNKILAATAMPNRIDPPVVSALKLAAVYRAELVVLHVLPGSTETGSAALRSGVDEKVRPADDLKSMSELQSLYKRYLKVYDRFCFQIGCGPAWKTISNTARHFGADTIILGPHDPGREAGSCNRDAAIKGTAQGVLHDAVRPVLIANCNISARMTALRTIVACVDFSETCRLALILAARMARDRDSRIIALHMHGIPPFAGYSQQHYHNDIRRLTHHLEIFTRQTIPGASCDHVVIGGSHPHLEILRFARTQHADMIVMGTRTGISNHRWYVGSAVEKVSLSSQCPVAVAPAVADRLSTDGPA